MPKASTLYLCDKTFISSVKKTLFPLWWIVFHAEGIHSFPLRKKLISSVKKTYFLCDESYSMPKASTLFLCEKKLTSSVKKTLFPLWWIVFHAEGILSFPLWKNLISSVMNRIPCRRHPLFFSVKKNLTSSVKKTLFPLWWIVFHAEGIHSIPLWKKPYFLCDESYSMPKASTFFLCEKNLTSSVMNHIPCRRHPLYSSAIEITISYCPTTDLYNFS